MTVIVENSRPTVATYGKPRVQIRVQFPLSHVGVSYLRLIAGALCNVAACCVARAGYMVRFRRFLGSRAPRPTPCELQGDGRWTRAACQHTWCEEAEGAWVRVDDV
jgi:hypothetical protein